MLIRHDEIQTLYEPFISHELNEKLCRGFASTSARGGSVLLFHKEEEEEEDGCKHSMPSDKLGHYLPQC